MPTVGLLLSSWLLSLLPGSAPDVAQALSRLSSASAGERAAAERELALELQRGDRDLLAAAARAGSAEVRARIASALSSDARHFALAAALAASEDDAVARTGSAAIAGQAGAWLGTSDQEPLPIRSVEREIRGAFSGLWSLDVSQAELEDLLDQIARLVDSRRADRPGSLPLALVLDSRFDPREQRPLAGAGEVGPVVVGSFDELVYAAAVTHGALFDVYGWHDGRPWIVVRPAAEPPARPAQALLLGWVLEVQRARDGGSARRAARALAGSGWPAALQWLDRRWSDERDGAALEGLVLAAGRGALARSLASPEGAQVLLERADRALAGPAAARRTAAESARALLSFGPAGRLAWNRGFEEAPAFGRQLRCALVAAAHDAPPELAAAMEARLLASDTSPEERCALLRALGALPEPRGQDRVVPGVDAAFEWALGHGSGREFPLWLRAFGGREPDSWRDGKGLGAQALAELAADALARSSEAPAALPLASARLASLLAVPRGEELGLAWIDRESLWVPKARLRAVLLGAREHGADADALARLLVCTALATAEETRVAAEAVFARKAWTDSDWRVAGAAIAQPGGALDAWPRRDAREDPSYEAFLERLEELREQFLAARGSRPTEPPAAGAAADPWSLQAGWVQACERALLLLRARQSEPGAREFLRRLRVYFQRTEHPLRRELSAGRFPPPSSALIVDVVGREPWVGF